MLNVCLTGEAEQLAGVDNHVSEVQVLKVESRSSPQKERAGAASKLKISKTPSLFAFTS